MAQKRERRVPMEFGLNRSTYCVGRLVGPSSEVIQRKAPPQIEVSLREIVSRLKEQVLTGGKKKKSCLCRRCQKEIKVGAYCPDCEKFVKGRKATMDALTNDALWFANRNTRETKGGKNYNEGANV